MIDFTKYDTLIKQGKGLLTNIIQSPTNHTNFRIEKYQNRIKEGWALYTLENTSSGQRMYCINVIDDAFYLKDYFSPIIDRDFSSILIGGLGLGMLPYLLKDTCQIIDIVEKNAALISIINNYGYINECNIIYADFYEYNPNKKYDVIVVDTFVNDDEVGLDQKISDCLYKYIPYLNENGIIYFPINRNKEQTIWNWNSNINELIPTPTQLLQYPPPTPTI